MFVLVDPADKQLDLFPPHLLSAEFGTVSIFDRTHESAFCFKPANVITKVITNKVSFEASAEGRRSRLGEASRLYVPVTRKVSLKPVQK